MQAFSLESLPFRIYGMCLAVGALAGLCWLAFRCRGMKNDTVLYFALLAVPLSFLMARLAQCLVSQGWHLFRENFFSTSAAEGICSTVLLQELYSRPG